ncbi:MAG: diphthine synthase [Candidatus Micrarchaeota archaeon]|nr:diphthine synthase [Candidatus Micrarchaeota archaeon]
MLYIIGTGVWRGDDIPYRGVEACRKALKVYLDAYTRRFEETEIEILEKIIGKKICLVDRKELEETLGFLKEAVEDDVVLLVPGDPLVATTHITILQEAKKAGIPCEIIHASSIYDALAGEAGLHIYKIGGSCTIPMRDKMIRPYSVYDKIADNTRRGMHTLVFLDTAPGKEMGVGEALEILQEIESERKEGIADDARKIVVGCRVGSREQKIVYGKIGTIKETSFKGPCTLIFPGALHFSEEEYLRLLETDDRNK